MSERARTVVLQRIPPGIPEPADFAFREEPLPELRDGEARLRVLALSLDPYLRSVIAGRHMSGAVAPGEVMRGEGLVEVELSRNSRFAPGSRWVAACGWRDRAVLDAAALAAARPVGAEISPPTLALGVLGMPGLTAWAGARLLAEAKPGDNFVVSAASGPVGATAGQLARRMGCRVIGIAGGARKCGWAIKEAGFDACLDYRAEDPRIGLARTCPKGVDVYFDNVGGDILQAVSESLAPKARIVLCGLMAQYNGAGAPGPNPGLFIRARATLRGLVVYDYWARYPEMLAELAPLVASGELKFWEDASSGLDTAPAAFCRLMRGDNQGKVVVRL